MGFIKQTEQFGDYSVASTDLSNYFVISEYTFAYNPSRINVGSIAYKSQGKQNSIVSPLYISFKTTEKLEDTYLWYWFKTQNFEKQREVFSEGGVRDTLSFNQLSEMQIYIPQLLEQQNIGILLTNIQKFITLQERKLELYKQLKKYLLQKMFANEQEKTPQIRFKGFDEDWKSEKLGNLVKFYSGLTYSPSDVMNSGTLVLRSSNIKNSDIVDADNVYVNSNIINSEKVKNKDIIVVVRNGSKNLIGKHAQVKHSIKNTVIGAFMTGIRSENPYFISSILDTQKFHIEINKNLGATINQITLSELKNMEFTIPNANLERKEIGMLINNISNLPITQKSKIDKAQQLKQYLLQNLFC
ncbi:restriction endonuclease subunit S [Lactobacillus sp. ESL0680]|uniref:restriction endonuclease subunit S n=1 Tax=Lactobacillus sp. ESL0680 TaxID=2983210 RepID=UPI0023F93943|nr:restriction endonuclease subunit S [Lactobacillus sp. ESL0680]WEV38153.1 restriction endonuclease subunit S [Lactobacillus sp. ESL0680]